MPILPRTRVARLEWAEEHQAPFTANATTIGLTSGQCTTMGTKSSNVRALYLAQQEAINAAKAATFAFYEASDDLTGYCSNLLKDIKSAAALNSAVWGLANVPAPAEPAPIGPPGMPDNFRANLKPGGALEMTFKCVNPRGGGVSYVVERKTTGGAGGVFTFLGVTGIKKFLDETVPANSGPVTYRITAARSTARGTPNYFSVDFGVDASGATVATVRPRIAA